MFFLQLFGHLKNTLRTGSRTGKKLGFSCFNISHAFLDSVSIINIHSLLKKHISICASIWVIYHLNLLRLQNFKWGVAANEIKYIYLFLTGVPSRISSKFFTNFASANIDVDGTLVDYVVKWYSYQELNQSIT